MLDTMTVTKVTASLCGALLVFLLGLWAAEEIYHVGGYGEAAYVIETEEDEGATEEVAEVNFEELMAAADVEKGARVFRKCSACHKIEDGANGTGPHLYGVVGRDKAGVDAFGYSDSLAGMEGDWTEEALDAFLERPSDYVPGTSMSFAGLKKIEDRVNVIAYLDSLDD